MSRTYERRNDRKGHLVDCGDSSGGRRSTVRTREQRGLLRARMIQESQQAAIVTVHDRDIKVSTYRAQLAARGTLDRRLVTNENTKEHTNRGRLTSLPG